MREAGGLEPHGIKTLSEIGVIIRMQLAREMQPNLVHITRQVHPAIHDFARTARVNDFAHARIIELVPRPVNCQRRISELTSPRRRIDLKACSKKTRELMPTSPSLRILRSRFSF